MISVQITTKIVQSTQNHLLYIRVKRSPKKIPNFDAELYLQNAA